MVQKPQNWENINENGASRKLPMGGYVAIIRKVEDNAADQYLNIEYDIAEGIYKGIAVDTYEAWGRWTHTFRVYYTDKALWRFKKFITRVEATNPGFVFDWGNPQCLVKRGIGLVIGIRHYWSKKDGSLKDALDVQDFCTATEVREGNLPSQPKEVDPKEPAPAPAMAPADDVTDDQLPF
jgi:hypothetical protein